MAAIFLGTPAAAIPSLCALAQVDDIAVVITQPDRPMNRSAQAIASPVKVAAQQFGFRVEQPASELELLQILRESGASMGLVVAYGRILNPEILTSLDLGFVNVHFSLLPRWRGAAPVERAIAAGDERTGVTLMKIDEGLDTGPVLGELATDIAPDDTGGSLTARLAYLGSTLVDNALPEYLLGRRTPVPQIATGATHAGKLSKQEARLDTRGDASVAARLVRAFSPRPGAWVATDAGRLRIHNATETGPSLNPVGEIGRADGYVALALASGALRLEIVQPEGKPSMDAMAWMNGRRGESVVVIDQ
ncbi:MAG: methionyl-tRNA formyltransferase [Actinomycetota bacterium]|nr:methionyl-tRNA formyltransferase [Actinomycetota bacterium]